MPVSSLFNPSATRSPRRQFAGAFARQGLQALGRQLIPKAIGAGLTARRGINRLGRAAVQGNRAIGRAMLAPGRSLAGMDFEQDEMDFAQDEWGASMRTPLGRALQGLFPGIQTDITQQGTDIYGQLYGNYFDRFNREPSLRRQAVEVQGADPNVRDWMALAETSPPMPPEELTELQAMYGQPRQAPVPSSLALQQSQMMQMNPQLARAYAGAPGREELGYQNTQGGYRGLAPEGGRGIRADGSPVVGQNPWQPRLWGGAGPTPLPAQRDQFGGQITQAEAQNIASAEEMLGNVDYGNRARTPMVGQQAAHASRQMQRQRGRRAGLLPMEQRRGMVMANAMGRRISPLQNQLEQMMGRGEELDPSQQVAALGPNAPYLAEQQAMAEMRGGGTMNPLEQALQTQQLLQQPGEGSMTPAQETAQRQADDQLRTAMGGVPVPKTVTRDDWTSAGKLSPGNKRAYLRQRGFTEEEIDASANQLQKENRRQWEEEKKYGPYGRTTSIDPRTYLGGGLGEVLGSLFWSQFTPPLAKAIKRRRLGRKGTTK